MEGRKDRGEEPFEEPGLDPEQSGGPEAVSDVDEPTEGEAPAAEAFPADASADLEDTVEVEPLADDVGEEALTAEVVGEDEDALVEDVPLDGAEEPSRLREEAERLQREAQARQQAAAELREEASRLREEAMRLLEQPQQLQAEAARLREELRAAQGAFEPQPEEVTAEDLPVPADDPITETEEPTTEVEGERRRGWLRRRRD